MKYIKNLLAFCTTLIFLSSCQKEISDTLVSSSTGPGNSSNTSAAKVKTYTEDITTPTGRSSTTFNLSYDTNDRLISMVSASSPGDKFVYQYNTNNSYTMDLYNSNAVSIHETFFLNSSGFIDSTLQYNDTKDTTTEKYLYNGSQQLTTLKEFEYSKTTGAKLVNTHNYVYDNNGNVTKDTDINGAITYDYTTLSNNLFIGKAFIPQNKNLPKTTTYSASGYNETISHTYTFDSSNRLISEKMVSGSGSVIIKSYTY
jgi:hypothetical protein